MHRKRQRIGKWVSLSYTVMLKTTSWQTRATAIWPSKEKWDDICNQILASAMIDAKKTFSHPIEILFFLLQRRQDSAGGVPRLCQIIIQSSFDRRQFHHHHLWSRLLQIFVVIITVRVHRRHHGGNDCGNNSSTRLECSTKWCGEIRKSIMRNHHRCQLGKRIESLWARGILRKLKTNWADWLHRIIVKSFRVHLQQIWAL